MGRPLITDSVPSRHAFGKDHATNAKDCPIAGGKSEWRILKGELKEGRRRKESMVNSEFVYYSKFTIHYFNARCLIATLAKKLSVNALAIQFLVD